MINEHDVRHNIMVLRERRRQEIIVLAGWAVAVALAAWFIATTMSAGVALATQHLTK